MATKFCNTFGVYMLSPTANIIRIERLHSAPFEGEVPGFARLYLERYQAASPELLQMFGAAGWTTNQLADEPIMLYPGDVLYFAQYWADPGDTDGKTTWYEVTIANS